MILGVRLNVRCTDPSHEGKSVKVKTYERVGWDSDRHWFMGATGAGGAHPFKPSKRQWPKPYADKLVGETLIKTTEQLRSLDPDNSRVRRRHTLECVLCGLKVDALNETLFPILDRLADHLPDPGVYSIELAHLAAMITKASRGA